MPADPDLRIEKDDGTERTTLDGITAQRVQNLVAAQSDATTAWVGRIRVDRDDWLTARPNFDRVNDRFIINRSNGTTFFAGRLNTAERDGNSVIVHINSYEQDAIDAEPSGGRLQYTNENDSTIFTDAIGNVATLQTGTVQTGATSVSFDFSHAEQAKIIRDAAEPHGQDVAYRFDRTVDFLDRLGSDKSGTITVSNTDQDIVDELTVTDNFRDPVTHIRGLGAQQGPDQVTASATVAGFSPGDKEVWREYVNKDVKNTDRMQEIVDRLAGQYDSNPRRLTVEAGLVGVDVGIGDSIQVDIPEENIDQSLRIIQLRELISTDAKLVASLSNRRPEVGGARKLRDDVGRFNAGDEGFVDRDNFRGVERQPVTSSVNAQGEYVYPSDVLNEVVAEVDVISIPYRAYSSGAASGGDDTTGDNSDLTGVVEAVSNDSVIEVLASAGWVTLDSLSVGSNTNTSVVTAGVNVNAEGATQGVDFRLRNTTTGTNFPTSGGVTAADADTSSFLFADPSDTAGETLELQANSTSDITASFSTYFQAWGRHTHGQPAHTHAADPGLTTFPNETASNVDLLINGNTVSSNIGSGEFRTTVDVSGEFSAGKNDIEIASDSLGLTTAIVRTQLFRRGRSAP